MKRFILIFLALLVLVEVTKTYKEDYYIIPEESIRIRILANSNSIEDQQIKKIVKTNIELEVENDLKDSKNITTSRTIINNNLSKYEKLIQNVLKNENKNQEINIDFGYHYFPEKKYKGVKYEAGEYESLLITLGEGKGDNWWCVLFPPICSLEVEDENTTDIEYTLFVKEMFEKYIK